MKLTAVNNITTRQNINNRKNNNQNTVTKLNNNVNFKGIADFATVFWNFVDKGGRGLQFTVEDMFGTNFPRTYQGAMAGYEYTHEINWAYLTQEGIREFLTGPTMTLAPIGILALVTKLKGDSANIHRKNISNLSHLADQLPKKNIDKETFKNSFIRLTAQDMLEKTTDKVADKSSVDTLIEGITKYGEQIKAAKTRTQKKQAKETLKNLGATFESIIKSSKDDLSNTSFQTVKYSTKNNQVGTTNFQNYVKYINAYIEDYAKANTGKDGFVNLAKDAIHQFENSARIKRAGTMAAMIFLTGYIMSFIPKLYTFFSGSTNPAGKAIYAEAQKREGK